MVHSSLNTRVGSLKYAAFAAVGLVFTAFTVSSYVKSVPPSEDLEVKRGQHRTTLRKKLTLDEETKLLNLTKAEWVNKEAGLARVPLNDAMDIAVSVFSTRTPQASSVKVDIPAVPAGDSPNMPSSPTGAVNIRFPSLKAPAETSN